MVSILLIPLLAGMFLAINMGGSGTAPSFSAAYGSDSIRRGAIYGLFGIFVLLGALVAGRKVILTIGRDILPENLMTVGLTTIILLAISLSLLVANLLRVPQSTSQATVAALIGVALYFGDLKTHRLLFEIIPAWFILPLASFAITLAVGTIAFRIARWNAFPSLAGIESHPVLKAVVISSCCYVAFSIGSNNVANAAGPLTSMVMRKLGVSADNGALPLCMMLSTLIIAPCFGIGSSIFGRRVLDTTGKQIVAFGPLGATLVSVITASLLLLASVTRGIPTSLVQLNTAAIVALGIAKHGTRHVLDGTAVRRIFTVWIVAPSVAFILALALAHAARSAGLL